jgi:putative Holliday junction resolvase
MGRILALDIGEKRVGVAVTDPMKIIAQPLLTINFTGAKALIARLKELISEQEVERIVVGIPYTLNGTESVKTRAVLQLKERLEKSLPVPFEEEDEALTTKMAAESLRMMGRKPSKSRDKIDQLAAVFILRSYLQRNN